MIRILIRYLMQRSKYRFRLVNTKGEKGTYRYCPISVDEFHDHKGTLRHKLPWYRPFNLLLHCWVRADGTDMHDHPRWSITVVLKGRLIEHTPKGRRLLNPGSVVVRKASYIHRIEVLDKYRTWTLFIVGRRKYRQQQYDNNGNVIAAIPLQ